MQTAWIMVLAGLLLMAGPAMAQGAAERNEQAPPSLTVIGRAEVSAEPDLAVLRLGATVQAQQAAQAQQQVNQIVQQAIESIRRLGVPDDQIQTVELRIAPVYSQRPPRPMAGAPDDEPRIVGFRADNVIQVRVADLALVGPIVDVGVQAGANRLESLSFQLRDDQEARAQALRQAAGQARAKAQAIAEAMDVRLESVAEVIEGGVSIAPPPFARAEMVMAGAGGAPVQPGQVQVQANVTVRYRLADVAIRPAQ